MCRHYALAYYWCVWAPLWRPLYIERDATPQHVKVKSGKPFTNMTSVLEAGNLESEQTPGNSGTRRVCDTSLWALEGQHPANVGSLGEPQERSETPQYNNPGSETTYTSNPRNFPGNHTV